MTKNDSTKDSSPAKQPKNRRPGKGGVYPPVEHQWKPGQSGNPAGRPKGSVSLQSHLRALLEADDEKLARALAQVMVQQGLRGDYKCLREIFERIDGRTVHKLAGHDGGPLVKFVGFNLDDV